MTILGLTLEIHDCSCSCGNKWTHSRPILHCEDGSYGGTPTALQEATLSLRRIYTTTRSSSHCFRCGALHAANAALPITTATGPAQSAVPPPPPPPPPPLNLLSIVEEFGLEKIPPQA